MSDQDKQIRFRVLVDEASARRAKSTISEITNELKKLFDTSRRSPMGSILGGQSSGSPFGNSVGQGKQQVNPASGFTKALQDQKNILKVVSTESKEAMRVMADAAKKSLQEQGREISAFERQIKGLTKTYDDLTKKAASFAEQGIPSLAEAYHGKAQGVASQMYTAADDRDKAKSTSKGLERAISILEKGGPGFMQPGGWWDRNKTTTMGIVGAAFGGMSMLGTGLQNMKTVESANKATTMNLPSQMLGEFMGGNFRSLMQLRSQGRSILKQASGTEEMDLADFGRAGTAVGGLVAKGTAGFALGGAAGAGAGLMSGAGDVVGAGLGIYSNQVLGGKEARESESIRAEMNNRRAHNPWQEASLDMLTQMASSRARNARRLQNNDRSAWGLGMGHGLSYDESAGVAEMYAGQVGMAGAMGHNVVTQQAQFVMGSPTTDSRGRISGVRGSYALPEVSKRVGSLMSRGLDLESRGFSREGAAGMLSGMFNATGSSDTAYKKLEEVFSKGFSKGVKEVNFFQEIGSAVAQGNFGAGGAVGGQAERAQMMFAGLNGSSSMHDLNSAVSGSRQLDSTFGSNQFLSANMLMGARAVMGGGMSGIAQRAVQQTSLMEMLGGSERLSDLGMSADQQRQTARKGVSMGLSSAIAGAGMGSAWDAAGGDISTFLNSGSSDEKKKRMGLVANSLQGSFGFSDYSSAKQAAAQLGEMGSLTGGKAGGMDGMLKTHGDGMAVTTLAGQQKVLMELMKEETTYRKAYMDSMKDMDKVRKEIEKASGDTDMNAGGLFVVRVMGRPGDLVPASRVAPAPGKPPNPQAPLGRVQ